MAGAMMRKIITWSIMIPRFGSSYQLETGEIITVGQMVKDLPDIYCTDAWDVNAHAYWRVVDVLDVDFREGRIWVAAVIEE